MSHLSMAEVEHELALSASLFEPVGTLDVLLPEKQVIEFQTILGFRKSPCWLIRSLLGRYRNRLLRLEPSEFRQSGGRGGKPRLRTRYQPCGLNLVRVSFRAEADVWVDLRMLSLSMRVSMSQIMVWLVQWEYRRWKLCQIRRRVYISWDRVGTLTENSLTLRHSEECSTLYLKARFSATRPLQPMPLHLIKEIQCRDHPELIDETAGIS